MTREELDAWVDGEPEKQAPTFHTVHKPPRKLRGVWRDKKMRADRSPMWITDYRNERHIWLRPITMKQRVKLEQKRVR